MAENQSQTAELALLLSEHHELLKELSGFQEWAAEVEQYGIPRFGEMGLRLKQLRDRLRTHFEHEEQGGYMSSVLQAASQLAGEVGELERQHPELLQVLNGFIDRLEQPEPPFASWQAAVKEFESILAELLRHESRENAAVRAAADQRSGGHG